MLLLVSAAAASALTIGRMRGAAWLGQPLDVNVQVQTDPGESLAALCFEAEVFHGDLRVDSGRVRVTPDNGAQPQSIQVRVQSSALIDEPVVSVYLRETCVSKTARRFVLLSEIPPEAPAPLVTAASAPLVPSVPAPAPRAAGPIAPPARAAAPAQVTPPLHVARPRAASPTVATGAAKPAAQSEQPLNAAAGAKTAQAAASAPAVKPKLKLDPVEVLRDRVAQLEAAAAQASQPAPSSQEALRLQKLEQSLQTLLTLAAKNERSLADLRQRLEQAESEKYDNALVYGLAALLLAALGGLGYLWHRQRQSKASKEAWWDDAERSPQTGTPDVAPVAAAVAGAAAVAAVAAATAESAAPEPSGEMQLPTEIDLDDLLAVGAESSGVPPDMDAVAGVEDIPVVDFPPLAPAAVSGASAPTAMPETTAGAAAMPEFPAAGEVHIDISHLSLSPVEQTPPDEAPAPLLDFDLPGFDQPAEAPRVAADKDDPAKA